jgi:tRNA nucleotidyltransferase (CCA-adding enzyme)
MIFNVVLLLSLKRLLHLVFAAQRFIHQPGVIGFREMSGTFSIQVFAPRTTKAKPGLVQLGLGGVTFCVSS